MGVTRREFVTMLLGGAAAAACRGGARAIDGALVETGMARGHAAIRDGARPEVATWRRHRVAIVGGGVAGLTAAWWLAKRGVKDCVVFELDDTFGGTARGGASVVTKYPWGAHYIVAPQRDQLELTALLAELGAIVGHEPDGTPIVDEALRCREPEERVFYRGRWYEGLYLEAGASAVERAQWHAFRAEIDRWSAWRDPAGRRAFAIPTARATDSEAVRGLDRMTFAHWLDAQGFTSERLRWLCDYACRDDYTLTAADASAWAGLFYFASRLRGPGAEPQSVVTWPDGNGHLVAHLARAASIERGIAVRAIAEAPDAIEVRCLGPDGAAFGVRADHVIVCAPSFVARRIVDSLHDAPVPRGDYGAWAVANVHLRERPGERARGGAAPAWDNVFRDSPSLGYVSATHQQGRDRGPTVWTWYYPFPAGDAAAVRRQLAGAGHAEWAETVVADLARAHPDIRGLIDRIDVAFWGHGMIRPKPGVITDPARAAARAPIAGGRIHFAHTDLSGLALFEEAFHHGLRAANEVPTSA